MIYVSSRSLRLITSERGTVWTSRPSVSGNSPFVAQQTVIQNQPACSMETTLDSANLKSSGLLSQAPQESASAPMDWVRNGDKVYR